MLSGERIVLRSNVLFDCGHSFNPAVDVGQVEGTFSAVVMQRSMRVIASQPALWPAQKQIDVLSGECIPCAAMCCSSSCTASTQLPTLVSWKVSDPDDIYLEFRVMVLSSLSMVCSDNLGD